MRKERFVYNGDGHCPITLTNVSELEQAIVLNHRIYEKEALVEYFAKKLSKGKREMIDPYTKVTLPSIEKKYSNLESLFLWIETLPAGERRNMQDLTRSPMLAIALAIFLAVCLFQLYTIDAISQETAVIVGMISYTPALLCNRFLHAQEKYINNLKSLDRIEEHQRIARQYVDEHTECYDPDVHLLKEDFDAHRTASNNFNISRA